jgi:hypothetical protein
VSLVPATDAAGPTKASLLTAGSSKSKSSIAPAASLARP